MNEHDKNQHHTEIRPRIGVAVIVTRDNKILVGKRKGGRKPGRWSVPGGHLEFGESLEAAVSRELFEETGISAKNIRFLTITNDIYMDENKHYVTLFFKGEYDSGEAEVKEPDRCESWQWVEWDKIPTPIFTPLESLVKTGYDPFKPQSCKGQ